MFLRDQFMETETVYLSVILVLLFLIAVGSAFLIWYKRRRLTKYEVGDAFPDLSHELESLPDVDTKRFKCPECNDFVSVHADQCHSCGVYFKKGEFRCPNCNAFATLSQIKCHNCGKVLESDPYLCPHCGNIVHHTAKVCPACYEGFWSPIRKKISE